MSKILSDKLFTPDVEMKATRDGYGDALLILGAENKDIVVLTADLAESTRVLKFGEKFPDRFFDVGVAEQNMMGVAAGLALSGKIPFVSSYAVFSPGRSWDQLRVSVAYSQANVKVAGAHTGLSVGPDGATHQALEDIAITRVLPNLVVIAPCDYEEAKKCTIAVAKHKGPVYFRFGREKTPVITAPDTPFQIGKVLELRKGKDVTLVACGPLVYEALLAAEELAKEGIEAQVLNNHTIKPIDKDGLVSATKLTGAVVTVEEHQVMGGMGSAVAECLVQNFPVPIEMIGVLDTFGESGAPQELLQKYHLVAADIVKAAKKAIKRKK